MPTAYLVDELQQQHSDEGLYELIEISHPDLSVPIRVVNERGTGTITALGQEWVKFPVQISFPSEPESGRAQAQISFNNVDLTISQTIRALGTPPTINAYGVRMSNPNVLEVSAVDLSLSGVEIDLTTVSADMTVDRLDQEPFPADRFSGPYFSSLGKARNE